MFVQLRRVVYLLVLLQCCACVAYAETSEEDGLTTKMNEKLKELNITAEELITNGNIAFSLLDLNLRNLQSVSENVELFAEEVNELVEEKSKPVPLDSEDAGVKNTTEVMFEEIEYIIKSVAGTTETVRLAIRYCKRWSDVLDKVIKYSGEPTGEQILSESEENFYAITPEPTYEYFYLLRAHIILATKRGNDAVEEVKKQEEDVEEALVELKVLSDTFKEKINKIREEAKMNSATSFEKIINNYGVETLLRDTAKEHEETADQIRNEDQPGEDIIVAKERLPQPPAPERPAEQPAEQAGEGQAEPSAPAEEPSAPQAAEGPSAPQAAEEPSAPQAAEESSTPQPEPSAPQAAEHATKSQPQPLEPQQAPQEPQPEKPEELAAVEPQTEGQAESSAPKEPSSAESERTSTADVPREQTANTTETGNSDAATPSTTTTAAALIEANKKGLQDAANAPMSSTAVLAVLALTVSTVIGMVVV